MSLSNFINKENLATLKTTIGITDDCGSKINILYNSFSENINKMITQLNPLYVKFEEIENTKKYYDETIIKIDQITRHYQNLDKAKKAISFRECVVALNGVVKALKFLECNRPQSDDLITAKNILDRILDKVEATFNNVLSKQEEMSKFSLVYGMDEVEENKGIRGLPQLQAETIKYLYNIVKIIPNSDRMTTLCETYSSSRKAKLNSALIIGEKISTQRNSTGMLTLKKNESLMATFPFRFSLKTLNKKFDKKNILIPRNAIDFDELIFYIYNLREILTIEFKNIEKIFPPKYYNLCQNELALPFMERIKEYGQKIITAAVDSDTSNYFTTFKNFLAVMDYAGSELSYFTHLLRHCDEYTQSILSNFYEKMEIALVQIIKCYFENDSQNSGLSEKRLTGTSYLSLDTSVLLKILVNNKLIVGKALATEKFVDFAEQVTSDMGPEQIYTKIFVQFIVNGFIPSFNLNIVRRAEKCSSPTAKHIFLIYNYMRVVDAIERLMDDDDMLEYEMLIDKSKSWLESKLERSTQEYLKLWMKPFRHFSTDCDFKIPLNYIKKRKVKEMFKKFNRAINKMEKSHDFSWIFKFEYKNEICQRCSEHVGDKHEEMVNYFRKFVFSKNMNKYFKYRREDFAKLFQKLFHSQ